MEPVRYDLRHCDGDSGRCRAEMEESEYGDYMSYESYAAQVAEIERLKAEVETERNRHRAWTDYFQTNQLTHAASRLEAAEDSKRRLTERVAELEEAADCIQCERDGLKQAAEFWKSAAEAQRRKNCDECVRIAGGRP